MTDQTKAPLLTTSEAADAVNRAKAMMSHASIPILARAMDDLDELYLAYERILTSAPSTPPSSAPETRTPSHSHRCMRCQKEFPCVAPVRCEAGPVVLPRIVYLDIFGRIQIRDHCRNVLYKGFVGQATFDTEAKVYHGEVEGIRDVVTFEADDEDGIESAFQASVDDYLDMLDVPIGKHDPYGTHTNGDGSPVLIPPAASHSPGTPAPAETPETRSLYRTTCANCGTEVLIDGTPHRRKAQ